MTDKEKIFKLLSKESCGYDTHGFDCETECPIRDTCIPLCKKYGESITLEVVRKMAINQGILKGILTMDDVFDNCIYEER